MAGSPSLADIERTVRESGNVIGALSALRDTLLATAGAEHLVLFAIDTRRQELFSIFDSSGGNEIRLAKAGPSAPAQAARSRKPVRVADPGGGWAGIAVPVTHEEYLLGVLELFDRGGRNHAAAEAAAALLAMTDQSLDPYTLEALDHHLARRLLRLRERSARLLYQVRSLRPREVTRASHGGPEDGALIYVGEFRFTWSRAAARVRLDDGSIPAGAARFAGRWRLQPPEHEPTGPQAPAATLDLRADGSVGADSSPDPGPGPARPERWTACEGFLFLQAAGGWTMAAARLGDSVTRPTLTLSGGPGGPYLDPPATWEYELEAGARPVRD